MIGTPLTYEVSEQNNNILRSREVFDSRFYAEMVKHEESKRLGKICAVSQGPKGYYIVTTKPREETTEG